MDGLEARSDGAEEDDIELTVDELMSEMTSIDQEIYAVRFNRALTPSAILERLAGLMETRNRLNDKLQRARAAEFRSFVESLNLAGLQMRPHFTARRCKLTLDPDRLGFLDDRPAADADSGQMIAESEQRRVELEKDLGMLQKKKFLSPSDAAIKLRMEAELRQIVDFSPAKK
jgi:hypothetical protein